MLVFRLVGRSVVFLVRNAWPLLAVPLLYLPVSWGLFQAQEALEAKAGKGVLVYSLAFGGFFLFQALLDLFYQALFFALTWSRLHAQPLTYRGFRDWLLLSFFSYYSYLLIYYLVSLFGFAFLMVPLFAFFIAFPFWDLVILFEHKPLLPAARENFALFAREPYHAAGLSLFRFLFLGWIPLLLATSGLSDSYFIIYSLVSVILVLPVDIAFVVLYSRLTARTPPGFRDLFLRLE